MQVAHVAETEGKRGRVARALSIVLVACACGSPGAGPGGTPVRSTAPIPGVTIDYTTPHFGFAICTPIDLHACSGTIPIRFGTRVTPPVDIAAGCMTEAAAEAACPGSSNEPAVQRCYAEHGVLIDLFGVADSSLPTYPSHFTLACDEGTAAIDFIEPF